MNKFILKIRINYKTWQLRKKLLQNQRIYLHNELRIQQVRELLKENGNVDNAHCTR